MKRIIFRCYEHRKMDPPIIFSAKITMALEPASFNSIRVSDVFVDGKPETVVYTFNPGSEGREQSCIEHRYHEADYSRCDKWYMLEQLSEECHFRILDIIKARCRQDIQRHTTKQVSDSKK